MNSKYTYPVLLALLLTATLVSCGREALPTGDTIQFVVSDGVTAELQTKTDASIKPNEEDYLIKAGNSIKIWADHKPATDEKTWAVDGKKVFDSQPQLATYTAEGSGYVWKYWDDGKLPVRWIKDHEYRFRAVFPINADIQEGTGGEKLEINYSMHESAPKGNYDLMVAAKDFDSKPADNVVSLAFHHACAALQFFFKTENPNTKIDGFELQYLHTIGTLNYTAPSSNDNSSNKGITVNDWILHGAAAPQVFHWDASSTDPAWPVEDDFTAFKGIDNWYFAIPQNLSDYHSNPPAVQFTYLVGDVAQDPVTLPIPVSYEDNEGFHSVVWEGGKVYLYYIQIQPSESKITFKVVDWEKFDVSTEDIIF